MEENSFNDLFSKLSPEQLQDVSYTLRVGRLISEKKLSSEGSDAARASVIAQELAKQGVDIRWLMLERNSIRRMRDLQCREHAASVSREYSGRQISLYGFAVPIGQHADGKSEFFLVPSIDFCNASAPPSTQVVYVQSDKGTLGINRTTPLQVTGKLKARTTTRSFAFPGNTLRFEADYALEPTEIKVIDWKTHRDLGKIP